MINQANDHAVPEESADIQRSELTALWLIACGFHL